MRWKISFFALIVLTILVLPSFSLASIEIGNLSHQIETNYTQSQTITGWINISLTNEPTNTLISAFNRNITVKKLIEDNSISCTSIGPYDCSCTPTDCRQTYSSTGSPFAEQNYPINIATTKLFGIKITETGLVTNITDFKFNISTNAGKSCINPLMIDLLDNGIDWTANEISTEECFIEEPYGCYNLSDSTISDVPIEETRYFCGRFNIPKARGFKIGTKITTAGTAAGSSTFALTIGTGGVDKTCTSTTTETTGEIEINCIVDLEQLSGTEAEVCILATAANTNTYNINFEDTSACGYIKDINGDRVTGPNNQIISHDYELFAKPLKYNNPPAEIKFEDSLFTEDTNLARLVYNHIDDKYNGDCTTGCIIPVRIYSGIDQELNISGLIVNYDKDSQNPTGTEEREFTEITETPALMSTEFLKLNLEYANFLTPRTSGEILFTLDIGDQEIEQNITITDIIKILDIIPKQAAFLVPTTFVVLLDQPINNRSNLTFTWNFGDGTPIQTTSTNSLTRTTTSISLKHTYTINGSYQLSVNVSDISSKTSSKTIALNVIAVKDAINNTIIDYRSRLQTVNNRVVLLPSWVQTRANQLVDTDDLTTQINSLENQFKSTLEADQPELVRIMTNLVNLRIPSKLDPTSIVDNIPFFQNENRFNILTIEEFGSETANASRTNQEYYNAASTWINNNLNITLESKTYTVYYDDAEETLFSQVKLIFTPKNNIEELYIVIEGDKSNIKFKEAYDGQRDFDDGYGIRLSSLSAGQSETIEFVHPETIDISNPPVYVSPEIRNLELGVIPVEAKDKKFPWTLLIISLSILFFIALVAYIIMQEWYKRNYESSLFKDKNQLFNLITFISNNLNQKLTRSQIFGKLKPLGWSGEQLDYAWKKLHGQRTGMWEIPIFRPFEKMKIKKEIAMRRGTVAPRPSRPSGSP